MRTLTDICIQGFIDIQTDWAYPIRIASHFPVLFPCARFVILQAVARPAAPWSLDDVARAVLAVPDNRIQRCPFLCLQGTHVPSLPHRVANRFLKSFVVPHSSQSAATKRPQSATLINVRTSSHASLHHARIVPLTTYIAVSAMLAPSLTASRVPMLELDALHRFGVAAPCASKSTGLLPAPSMALESRLHTVPGPGGLHDRIDVSRMAPARFPAGVSSYFPPLLVSHFTL